tara:strand:- start:447 stop:752 length:306 start_codon:yes stop_codon:yes gene_type:complete
MGYAPFKMKYKNLEEVVEQLNSAVVAHGKQAKTIKKHINEMESPAKKYVSDAQRKAIHASKAEQASPVKGKLKPCQKTAAKKKFDVYPSAYANMWASSHKC